MHLFCLIQKYILKNNSNNNHNTLPESWPCWNHVVYCNSACDKCSLLCAFERSFAILNLGLDCLGVCQVPCLYLDTTSPHAHFTICWGIQLLSWWGLPDSLSYILQSLGISQIAWGICYCWCVPISQSSFFDLLFLYLPFLQLLGSRLEMRDEEGSYHLYYFPVVTIHSITNLVA